LLTLFGKHFTARSRITSKVDCDHCTDWLRGDFIHSIFRSTIDAGVTMDNKVVVAMSGGVDSSVAAAILKGEGYDVVGITMQLWLPGMTGDASSVDCCGGLTKIGDAAKVAELIGIPHRTIDFKELFKKMVIADFCAEYTAGRTPNPCIRCNEYVKFGALLHKAKELGARYIATGHHARIERGTDGSYMLKKGSDQRKDQTYVLYRLTQEQLGHTLLPIGALTKDRVRGIARELGLPVASKAESQDICFIPDNDYIGFLFQHIPDAIRPGPILDKQGEKLGEHRGSQFYTIGQRRKLGITAPEPLYITTILPEMNAVVVGRESDLYSSSLIASKVNWISGTTPAQATEVTAKIRYAHHGARAEIQILSGSKISVLFSEPQKAIAPGQSVVFYDRDTVLGGGIIERSYK